MNILVVDDTDQGRYMLETFLKANGHEVTGAADGQDALEGLRIGTFDLIISDILMPVMDGFELCRRVKKDEKLRHIPFIFYTATYTGAKDEAFAMSIGADGFIHKPCDLDEFLKAVHQITAASGKRGVVSTPSPAPEQKALKLYNERLVRKLELSKIQLETEVRARKRAEEAARAAANNWQITFDAMLDPVVLLAPDGVIRQSNQAFADFVGVQAPAVVGQKCFQLVHRTKGHIEGCPLLRSLKSADREVMPMSVGEEEFLVVTDPIKGPDNRITGLVHIMRNITELKLAHEVLRESEDRYRDLVENSQDLICTHDLEGRILSLNLWPARLLGYDRDALVGKNLRELLPPENAPAFYEYLKTIRTEGSAKGLLIVQTRSGQRRVWKYNNTLRTEGVEEPIVRGMARDITERMQAEEKLRESEETYRNIFQNAQVGLYRTRISDGKILESNEQLARMFGYDTRDEFVAEYVTSQNYVDPGTRKRMLDEIKKNGVVKNFEVRFYRKDRSIFWARYSAKIYPDKGWIEGVAEDITEHKRAEAERERLQAELIQAQKMESVGRLAGGIAHDFNNMLTIILGYGENLMAQLPADSPLREQVRQIIDAGSRSAALTQQLLAFSRKQVISPRVLDLNDTVENMLKMVRRLIGEDIDLIWLPGHDVWRVNMDPTQIDQILANLTLNARDAISGVGRVTIQTKNIVFNGAYCADHAGALPGDHVMLSVSDDGCGMDQETLDHLFEPFFTTKEVGKGTGMGLPTVYGIVKQNNGFIDVESEPGKGTVVSVYLPRVEGEAFEEKEVEAGELPRGRGEMVLLVEDEPVLLQMAKAMLERFGYRVLTASRPKEAIERVQEHGEEIQLLMTDVVLPQMSGQDLAHRLREIRPGLRCLFMSGYTAEIIAKRGMLDKGVHFLEKPFTLNELAWKVRKALEVKSEE